jgi:hypothetical protein
VIVTRDLIAGSLRLIGAVAPGDTLDAQEATDGLAALNAMIESWSLDKLLVYAIVREAFSLTPGDGVYSMGASGDFNTPRPVRVEQALIRDETVTPAIEIPISIRTMEEWSGITVKDVQSPYPTDLYPEGTNPLETLNLYPVPSAAHKLVLYSWKPLSQIATLDTVLTLPPGYDRALKFNLAIELAPEYAKPAPAEVVKIASDSMAALKRVNHRPRYLRANDIPVAKGTRSPNSIFSGGS